MPRSSKRRKVLVTGASGQVGVAILEQAGAFPFEVVGVNHEQLDLGDVEQVRTVCDRIDPNIIVNAAAYTAVDRAEAEVKLAFAVNAEGPGALAQWCAQRDRALVHISTDYVFSGTSSEPYREDAVISPLNVYGHSKALGEQRVRDAGARHLILRTSWVYATTGRNFMLTMLNLGRERDILRVVDDQTGSPTFAPDIAAAIFRVLDRWNQGVDAGGTVHFAAAGETTWYGFAQFIFQHAATVWGRRPQVTPIPTRDYPTPAQRPGYSVLDTTLFEATFAMRPPQWQDSAATALQSILKQGA